jgi:hypothetical protein
MQFIFKMGLNPTLLTLNEESGDTNLTILCSQISNTKYHIAIYKTMSSSVYCEKK